MVDYAKKYEEQLKTLHRNIAFDWDYLFYHCYPYREEYEIDKTTWEGHSFVSLHNDGIVGEISYKIRRDTNSCYGLAIVHFGKDNSYVFASDLMRCLRDVFEKYHFGKLNYSVVIGNPMEPTYDKMTAKYGGSVLGIFRQDVRLMDGQLYDQKFYEILAKDYFSQKDFLNLKKME